MPTPAPPSPDTAHSLGLLRNLAAKRGLSPAALDPTSLALLLTACVQTLAHGEPFSEKAFNQRLSAWIAGEGRMLRTDFAELRRSLVDLQFCQRDGYGKVYQRAAAWPPAWRALCATVESTDLNLLLATARAEETERRVQRKQRALATPPDPA